MALFHPRFYASLARRTALLGVGGRTWTPIVASGDGLSAARTLAVAGLVTLYVVRNDPDRLRIALPQASRFTADWLAVGAADLDLAAETTLVSVADPQWVFAVLAGGAADLGVFIGPLAPATNPLQPAPAPAAMRRIRQGTRLGLQAGF